MPQPPTAPKKRRFDKTRRFFKGRFGPTRRTIRKKIASREDSGVNTGIDFSTKYTLDTFNITDPTKRQHLQKKMRQVVTMIETAEQKKYSGKSVRDNIIKLLKPEFVEGFTPAEVKAEAFSTRCLAKIKKFTEVQEAELQKLIRKEITPGSPAEAEVLARIKDLPKNSPTRKYIEEQLGLKKKTKQKKKKRK